MPADMPPPTRQFNLGALSQTIFQKIEVTCRSRFFTLTEQSQNIFHTNHAETSPAKQLLMPGPLIAGKVIQAVNHSGTDRVEMNITDQFEQVIIGIANYGFVAVLKQMAAAIMPQIKHNGVAGQQAPHQTSQGLHRR